MTATLTLFLAAAVSLAQPAAASAAAQAAPPAAPPVNAAEQAERGQALQIFEQLMAEDGNIAISRPDNRGNEYLYMHTRGRASNVVGGTCERDHLTIQRSVGEVQPWEAPGVRSVRTTQWFYILRDADGQPLWEVRNSDQQRLCAEVSPNSSDWFEADDATAARSASAGLFALREELQKANPRRAHFACRPHGCPSASDMAARITPLRPSGAWREGRECPEDDWCVRTLIQNVGCGAWSTQLRMDRIHTDRFRSARIDNFVGALHCGEEGM